MHRKVNKYVVMKIRKTEVLEHASAFLIFYLIAL